jgi:hypothetical protein
MAVSSVGYSAPPQKPAEKTKQDKAEAERQEIYALVKKIGLYKIEKRETLTLKFLPGGEGLFDMLKVRYKGKKSAIFIESWKVGDPKPYYVNTFGVEDFAAWLEIRLEGGWEVELIEYK